MKRNKLLYKSKVEYMNAPGVYTMNHVLGCSHGCKYPCYAFMSAKRYGQVGSYEQWCKPEIVDDALEILERDLKVRRKEPIERVHMCFTTDPFMFEQDDVCQLTLDCIRLINSYGIPVTTLTKGQYPFGFDPTAAVLRGHPGNEYGITFASRDVPFLNRWEPGTSLWEGRFECARLLQKKGVHTWLSLEPFPALRLPGSNDPFSALYEALSFAGYFDRVVFGRWNYNPNMPTDFEDVDAWYREAVHIVEEWGRRSGIETIIKKGTV